MLRHAGILRKILLDAHELLAKAYILILVQLTDHLRAKELGGLLHELVRRLQRIRKHHFDLNGTMSASELFQQMQRNPLFGGVCGSPCGFARAIFGGQPLPFSRLVFFLPSRQGGIGEVKRETDRQSHLRGDQQQQDQVLPINIPTTALVLELMGFEHALGDFAALFVRVIYDQITLSDRVSPQHHGDAQLQQSRPGNLGVAKYPR
jgi:hypothetical protein